MSNRYARRRQNKRAKPQQRARRFSGWVRLALIGGGILAVGGGVALLLAGGPDTARRLGRVAGILIVLGFVAIVAGVLGQL